MKRLLKWAGICVVLLLGVAIALGFTPFGRNFFDLIFMKRNIPFDQRKLEKIVQKVKETKLKPGDQIELRVTNMNDPGSLRARVPSDNDRGRGAGNVWAEREPGGALVVVIETQDNGHAGTYGYVYAEVEPHETADRLWSLGGQTYMSCTQPSWKVADKWWQVRSCYLD
jgi:hypothetical protein